MTVDHTCHTIAALPDGVLKFDGFEGVDVDACFCIVAYGSRYHEYGIADNSLLYCCQTNKVTDGDLVLVFEEGFRPFTSTVKTKALPKAEIREFSTIANEFTRKSWALSISTTDTLRQKGH